jgi:hypothetical protein
MKNLIIGAGEVGTGLQQIFSKSHQTFIRDIEKRSDDPGEVEILHIAIRIIRSLWKTPVFTSSNTNPS